MAWSLSGSIVTQSGTDTDLSGLSAIAGVTTTTLNNRKIYNIGVLSLRISGTLTISPRTEQIIAGTTTTLPTFASSAATANLTIGQSVTQSGAKVFTTHPWFVGTIRNTNTYVFNTQNFNWQAGTFTWHEGAAIFPNGASWGAGVQYNSESDGAATITINEGASLQGAGYAGETQFHFVERNAVINGLRVFGLSSDDVKISLARLRTAPKIILNGSYGLTSFTSALRNEFLTLRDYVGTAMFGDARFWDGCRLRFVNSALGTGHIVREHTTGGSRQGIAEFRQELTVNTKTSAGAAIGGSVSYLKDVTNVNRVNYTFTTPNIDYRPDNTYVIAHNATTGVGTYTTDGGVLVGVVARTTDGSIFPFDRRGNADSSADLFTIHTWSYDYQYTTNTRALKGNGGTNFDAVMVADSNVTLSETAARAKLASSFIVNPTTKVVTVTANSTFDDLYDILKAYKVTATTTNLETPSIDKLIVTASGSNLTAYIGWTLVVNTGVTLSAGTKFTYVYFPTVTLNGTGQITGVYASTAGTSTVWQFQSIEVGTSLVVYDSSGVTKYFRQEVSTAGTYSMYIPPGTTGTYYYAVEKYGKKREEGNFPANSGGILFYVPDYQDDVGVTQATQATVAAYTTLETSEKLYDYIAYFRLGEQGIKLGQIATRAGTAIEFGSYSGVVKSTHTSVLSVTGSTITIKANGLAGTTKYATIIATPPATWTANSTEVIDIDIEDGNGDSSITISASGISTFEIWKITDATNPDDYATGTLMATVGIGKWRFLHANGYKFVIRDITTNYRVVVEAEKGVYEAALFFGAAVQLAQAAEVTEINNKVDIMQIDVDAIKGTGFLKDKHSLTNIKKKAALAAALSA